MGPVSLRTQLVVALSTADLARLPVRSSRETGVSSYFGPVVALPPAHLASILPDRSKQKKESHSTSDSPLSHRLADSYALCTAEQIEQKGKDKKAKRTAAGIRQSSPT